MMSSFIFEAEPFEAYPAFESHELEEEFGNFRRAVNLAGAWRTIEPKGGVYALFKNGNLVYVGESSKLGGVRNRLYNYRWYGKSLDCGLDSYTVRVRYIADEAARKSLEKTLRDKLQPPGNILELEDGFRGDRLVLAGALPPDTGLPLTTPVSSSVQREVEGMLGLHRTPTFLRPSEALQRQHRAKQDVDAAKKELERAKEAVVVAEENLRKANDMARLIPPNRRLQFVQEKSDALARARLQEKSATADYQRALQSYTHERRLFQDAVARARVERDKQRKIREQRRQQTGTIGRLRRWWQQR